MQSLIVRYCLGRQSETSGERMGEAMHVRITSTLHQIYTLVTRLLAMFICGWLPLEGVSLYTFLLPEEHTPSLKTIDTLCVHVVSSHRCILCVATCVCRYVIACVLAICGCVSAPVLIVLSRRQLRALVVAIEYRQLQHRCMAS